VERLEGLAWKQPEICRKSVRSLVQKLVPCTQLAGEINAFWLDDRNRESVAWSGHSDINMAMLATSLEPEGYLSSP